MSMPKNQEDSILQSKNLPIFELTSPPPVKRERDFQIVEEKKNDLGLDENASSPAFFLPIHGKTHFIEYAKIEQVYSKFN